MQEGGDDRFLIQSVLFREDQGIDAAELAVRPFAHQALDGVDSLWVGRLPQDGEQGVGFTHGARLRSPVVAAKARSHTIWCDSGLRLPLPGSVLPDLSARRPVNYLAGRH